MPADHGLTLGLRDDDHPQYYNTTRLNSWYSGKAPNAHTHLEADITDLGTYSVVGHGHTESDISDIGTHTHSQYAASVHDHDTDYVELTGDTMSGDLVISKASPEVNLVVPDVAANMAGIRMGAATWEVFFGTQVDEYWMGIWSSTKTGDPEWGWSSTWMRGPDGSAAAPAIAPLSDTATGLFWPTTDVLSVSVNGVEEYKFTATAFDLQGNSLVDVNEITLDVGSESDPSIHFDDNLTTGAFLPSSGVWGITTGGTERMRILWSELRLRSGVHFKAEPLTTTQTTDPAEWVNTTGSIWRIQRSSSSARYKTDIRPASDLADIDLTPVHFWSVLDEKEQIGFIAEDIEAVLPGQVSRNSDGQVESYDTRAVIAVLAAKVNRLEERAA